MLAYIAGQVVQVIKPVKINIRRFDVADLGNNLPFRSLDRNLDIARYGKYVLPFEPIASAHPVKAVIQPEIFCSADQHRFSNVENSLYYPVIIHRFSPWYKISHDVIIALFSQVSIEIVMKASLNGLYPAFCGT